MLCCVNQFKNKILKCLKLQLFWSDFDSPHWYFIFLKGLTSNDSCKRTTIHFISPNTKIFDYRWPIRIKFPFWWRLPLAFGVSIFHLSFSPFVKEHWRQGSLLKLHDCFVEMRRWTAMEYHTFWWDKREASPSYHSDTISQCRRCHETLKLKLR